MTDTRFAPEAAVTREQMVTILYRYAKLKDADVTAKGDLESFPDHDQVKPYARDAFSWAVGAGIIQGDSNGSVATLSPRNSATRCPGRRRSDALPGAAGLIAMWFTSAPSLPRGHMGTPKATPTN